ncbi:hypothetical protein O9H85_09815 [Paenibacillus filicis]|uniref:DUF4139 domain-containing protein n=1 Tax=Paenibacillus gyeongsangnamensis TaxID=3388067 RepID=A0ABT4Q758_9BACL|nr:hypothetical protein [Paenibacillus filicis]MCZ8512705.1 hypothetical protein [Paenibacillus filicis]
MNMQWKTRLSTVLLASSVALGVAPAYAAEPAAAPAAEQLYVLNSSTQAQVKSVLQEKTPTGWRIGAVIKLYNTSLTASRIPDYELRALTTGGAPYILQPSAANPKSIPPQSYVELSYMAEPDTQADLAVTDLALVDVNMEVYPKVETLLADAPVSAKVWHGSDAVLPDASLKAWSESFLIPGITSGLKYTAVSVTKQFSGQAPTYTVQMKVDNPGSATETVPDFTLSGKSEGQSFIGKRAEQGPVALNPGEQKYIHFSITTTNDAKLSAFYVLTPESFLKQGQTAPSTYYIGRIGVQLPSDNASASGSALPVYEFGKPLAVDPVSQAISPQMAVSLMGLQWFENEGQQYRTVVAKVRYVNNGGSSLAVPEVGADLGNSQGVYYSGVRMASPVKEVLPGLGAIVNYTFTVPKSEKEEQFKFRLLEPAAVAAPATASSTPATPAAGTAPAASAAAAAAPSAAAAVKSPISEAFAAVQNTDLGTTTLQMYPYELKLGSWVLTTVAGTNPATRAYTYTYKVKMSLDVNTTDEVVADPVNQKLFMQLENGAGTRLTYKSFALTGDSRLMSGEQTIAFDNGSTDQMEAPLVLKIYETISTPLGDAKRLIAELKQ